MARTICALFSITLFLFCFGSLAMDRHPFFSGELTDTILRARSEAIVQAFQQRMVGVQAAVALRSTSPASSISSTPPSECCLASFSGENKSARHKNKDPRLEPFFGEE